MAVFRVDVLVDDPYPVFDWINEHVQQGLVVRKIRVAEMVDWDKAAYSLAKGPFIESILERGLRSTECKT